MIGDAEVKKVLSCLGSVLLLSSFFIGIGIGGASAQDKTTLSIMLGTWWKDQAPIVEEKYEQTHPDVDLVYRLMGYQGMREQMVTNLVLGKAADILTVCNAQWVPGFMDKDLFAPWDEYVGPDKPIKPELFMPQTLELYNIKGHQWSIPFTASARTLFCNRNMFKEAGLDPDVTPHNMKEVKKFARFLTNPEKDIYGYTWEAASGSFETEVLDFLWNFGASLYNEKGTKATVNSPEAIEAVDFLASFVEEGLVPQECMGFTDNQRMRFFGLRKCAMVSTHFPNQWVMDDTWPDIDFSKDITPSILEHGFTEGKSFGMRKNIEHPEEAARFMGWFIENLAELGIRIPCTKRMGDWLDRPRVAPFVRQMEANTRSLNLIAETTQAVSITVKQIQRVCMGEVTAEEAMNIAAKEINKILSD